MSVMLLTLPLARIATVPVPLKLTHARAEYDGADPDAVDSAVAVDAFPDSAAVIVPALKFPDASRATMVEPVFALVAFDVTVKVALPD